MLNKSYRPNVIPATVLAAGSTTKSQVEQANWGRGIRFWITVTLATTTGGTDSIMLCGAPPMITPVPPIPVIVPLVGISGVSFMSINGVWAADFYPGAWLPGAVAAGGHLLGAVGIEVPANWAVQIGMAAGSTATVRVDAEMLP